LETFLRARAFRFADARRARVRWSERNLPGLPWEKSKGAKPRELRHQNDRAQHAFCVPMIRTGTRTSPPKARFPVRSVLCAARLFPSWSGTFPLDPVS